MKVIIHREGDALIVSKPNAKEVAVKGIEVVAGALSLGNPYVIIDESELPATTRYRSAWDIEAGKIVLRADKVAIINAKNAPSVRDEALDADLYVEGLDATFKYDEPGRTAIRETFDDALALGVHEDAKQPWRLADNSWKIISVADLRTVRAVGAERRLAIWTQFNAWDSGDRSAPFSTGV